MDREYISNDRSHVDLIERDCYASTRRSVVRRNQALVSAAHRRTLWMDALGVFCAVVLVATIIIGLKIITGAQ